MSGSIPISRIAGPTPLGEGTRPESARAKADRDFRTIFLREMLRPVTSKLWNSTSLGGEPSSASSGSGVYQFFMEEALASKLAEAWPLPQVIPEKGNSASLEDRKIQTIGPRERVATRAMMTPAPQPRTEEVAPSTGAGPGEAAGSDSGSGSGSGSDGKIPKLPESLITRAARIFELPRNLVRAVVLTESGGRVDAVSSRGAQGLMQLMPGTAKEMGISDSLDAWQNLYAGTRYLSRQLARFEDLPQALAAYNAGPGAVERHQGIPPYAETRRYVEKVLALKSRLDAQRP